MPGYGAFDGHTYDDDAFDTDIFESVPAPSSTWDGKTSPVNSWTPTMPPIDPPWVIQDIDS